MTINMTSSKPYLIRAIYEWILDNNCTPFIAVDTRTPYTDVPTEFIQNNEITLDISPTATHQLLINNEAITFDARFGGRVHQVYIPIAAVMAIYTPENDQGMSFPENEFPTTSIEQAPSKTNKFELKVISGGKDQD